MRTIALARLDLNRLLWFGYPKDHPALALIGDKGVVEAEVCRLLRTASGAATLVLPNGGMILQHQAKGVARRKAAAVLDRDYALTRAALAAYDADEPKRQELGARARTPQERQHAAIYAKRALNKLRAAYAEEAGLERGAEAATVDFLRWLAAR